MAFQSVCASSSSSSSSSTSDLPSSSSSSSSTSASSSSTSLPTSAPSSPTSNQSTPPHQTTTPPNPDTNTPASPSPKPSKTEPGGKEPTPSSVLVTTTDEQGRTTTVFVPAELSTDTPPDQSNDGESSSGLSKGAVAALASVGSVVGVALLVGGWYACRKSSRRQEELELEDSILFGQPRPSVGADPFLGPLSNATSMDAEEVLGVAARNRTSAYVGAGVASTFPAPYSDKYDDPALPRSRSTEMLHDPVLPRSRSVEMLHDPALPRSRSVELLHDPALPRSGSLEMLHDSAPATPRSSSDATSIKPRYARDEVAEFVTISSPPARAHNALPRTRARRSSSGNPLERPQSWVDADAMLAERVAAKRASRVKADGQFASLSRVASHRRGSASRSASRDFDGAREPLLG